MSGPSLENKDHDEMAYSPSSLRPPVPHPIPRRPSLRLLTTLTTPHTPVPPSLEKSPYLTSPVFSHGLPSPTLPSEEDEKWLQDTIPIPSRHHVQVPGPSGSAGCSPLSARADRKGGGVVRLPRRAVAGQRGRSPIQKGGGAVQPSRRHASVGDKARGRGLGITSTSNPRFIPPSLAFIPDSNLTHSGWRSAVLCTRRWSTGPLRPPNPDKTFPMLGN